MSSLPDSHRSPVGPPSEVQVTVFRLPDDGALHLRVARRLDRIPTRAKRAVAVLLGLAALGGLGLAIALGTGGPRGDVWGVTEPGPAGVAAAYGYPLSCLRVTISASDPAFARAEFDHHRSCGYASGFATALFHRFDGEWHPVLYSVTSP
jgi:hypothetical protein